MLRWIVTTLVLCACVSLGRAQVLPVLAARIDEPQRLTIAATFVPQSAEVAHSAARPLVGADVEWVFARGAGRQLNLDVPQGPLSAQSVSLPVSGAWLIGLEAASADLALSAGEWQVFARAALPEPSAPGDRAVRFRHFRSAKQIIAPERQTRSSTYVISKTGQNAEIRPMTDPLLAQLGADLPVVVYIRGQRAVGVRLKASALTAGRSQSLTTDSAGSAVVSIDTPGAWLLQFHATQPADGDPRFDFDLYSGTLRFDVAAPQTKEGR